MRIDWVKQDNGRVVVVFFNGWGMDSKVVNHLSTEYDLAICSDYRTLQSENGEIDFSPYSVIYVVAWSMGVWAAANIIPRWGIKPDKWIAFNGTERPIDNHYGIPVLNYELTEKGMTEKGREKFFTRMLVNKNELTLFSANKPERMLTEQIEELCNIHKLSSVHKNCVKWDKVFISERDFIFPPANQFNWWQGKTDPISLPGGHYPFYEFRNWEDIL